MRDGESLGQFAEWLNEPGVPTSSQNRLGAAKTGKDSIWTAGTIWKMVRNRKYTGKVHWNRRSRSTDEDDPRIRHLKINPKSEVIVAVRPELKIVEPELWQAANDAVKARCMRIENKGHARQPYLLRGLIYCSCGKKFAGCLSHYRCVDRFRAKLLYRNTQAPCDLPSLPTADAEQAIRNPVEKHCRYPFLAIEQLEARRKSQQQEQHTVADRMRETEGRRRELAETKRVLLRQLTNGFIGEPEFEREATYLPNREAGLATELDRLRKQAASLRGTRCGW